MATAYTNADGLVTYFGTRDVENKRTNVISDNGPIKTVQATFDYSDSVTPVAADTGQVFVPANAFIVDAFWQTYTAWVGGTSWNVGLVDIDGANGDPNGLWAALPIASVNAIGETATGLLATYGGAIVGLVGGVGSADLYLEVTATGTFTAGAARIIVRYLPIVTYDSF
jgi:hypothetical protein